MDTEKKQLELDKRYIRMASIWAENSYCHAVSRSFNC